jgi:hypothetical protein
MAFQEWLSLGLSAQFSDLVEYLSTFSTRDREVVLRVLGTSSTHNAFIPLNTRLEEQELFSSDLKVLAELQKMHPFQQQIIR